MRVPDHHRRSSLRAVALSRVSPMDDSLHMEATMPFAISDLRQRPEFFDVVADRIWQAWWKADGHPLGYITSRLQENLSATPIPLALVAHDGRAFLGTASVIASDLPKRPQLTPWVAAVWVEPQARSHGIGAALVNRATEELLRRPGLDADRTGCRATPSGRVHPRRAFRSRSDQPFAAMKIDRPKPVR